ncbi:MAG: 50S ribosomal protein L9 [Candidatus Andersenbacteria bacterium]
MSKRVQVILLENDPTLGRAGEIVTVSEGYARNFLFPVGKAALATLPSQRAQKEKQQRQAKKEEKTLEELQAKALTLEGTELTIPARVKEAESIFGSISAAKIAQELKRQAKLSVTPKQVVLKKPITELGSVDVVIKLSPAVETAIRVTVVAEPGSVPKPEDE